MGRRRRQTHHVQQGPATHHRDVIVPIDVMSVNEFQDLHHTGPVVLHDFPAGDPNRGANELKPLRMGFEIGFYLRR